MSAGQSAVTRSLEGSKARGAYQNGIVKPLALRSQIADNAGRMKITLTLPPTLGSTEWIHTIKPGRVEITPGRVNGRPPPRTLLVDVWYPDESGLRWLVRDCLCTGQKQIPYRIQP